MEFRIKVLCCLAGGLLLAGTAACDSISTMLNGDEKTPDSESEVDRYTFIKRDRMESDEVKRTATEEELPPVAVQSDTSAITLPPQPGDKAPAVPAAAAESRVKEPGSNKFYSDLIALNGNDELAVRIELNSAPLVDALPAFADILGFNFIVDSDIKNVLTVNINAVMTRRELWETLDNLLFMAGCTAKLENQVVKIVPISKMGQQRDFRVIPNAGGNSGLIFYALKNVSAATAQELLQPFCSTNCIIKPVTAANALLIADDPGNTEKLIEILKIIDTSKNSLWPRMIIKCDNVVPSTAAGELAALLPVLGFSVNVSGSTATEPGAVQLMGIDRLQLLVVSAATKEALREIREWVKILDSSDNSQQERMYVYKVTNGKAEQLAQALSIMFNVTTGSSLTVESSESVGTNSNTRNLSSSSSSSNTTSGVDNLPNTIVDRTSSVFEVPVRVFSDGVYNRLVIRTTPRCYAMIKALLDRLDTVPSQVLIQIMLAEVALDDSTMFGMEFSYAGGNGAADSLLQTNYEELRPDDGSAGEGFSYLITNPDNPDEKFGYLRAKAGKSRIKVISAPQVLVSSNSEATVQIGYDVPLLTQSITNTSSAGSMSQTFEYRQTGIILGITPQVTSNNLISFEISQEISEPVENTLSNIDTPMISVRKITSTMTIANGRTMILGGLIQEKETEELDSVPIIASIPILNTLTGKTNNAVKRTEVLMLITGYIINEQNPVENLIRRYNNSVREFNKFENHIESEAALDDQKLTEFHSKGEPVVVNLNEADKKEESK
ncbi:MAG: hypothetical protein AB7F40_06975 [Victivallaceae bacterium]